MKAFEYFIIALALCQLVSCYEYFLKESNDYDDINMLRDLLIEKLRAKSAQGNQANTMDNFDGDRKVGFFKIRQDFEKIQLANGDQYLVPKDPTKNHYFMG